MRHVTSIAILMTLSLCGCWQYTSTAGPFVREVRLVPAPKERVAIEVESCQLEYEKVEFLDSSSQSLKEKHCSWQAAEDAELRESDQ